MSLIKIQIKSWLTGKLLFEYESENNTVKNTVEKAINSGANLYGADLSGANLSRADLYRANLSGADLSRANLYGANLYGANLSRANLSGADLSGANISRADLSRADLYGAEKAELAIAKTRILPDGDIIGYKKCLEGIVKLLIPKEAKRSSAFGRKCRAEYAIVLELPDGFDTCTSEHDNSFTYKLGETVKPKEPFSEDWQEECASGIHFYITKLEAENH